MGRRKDEEGNVTGGRWESRSSYDKQRSNSGEWPMLVHDGTGGMAIQAGVLSGGRRIREWDRHDDSLWRRRPSGNVRNLEAKHVWYGTGWSMGDPLFLSGTRLHVIMQAWSQRMLTGLKPMHCLNWVRKETQ